LYNYQEINRKKNLLDANAVWWSVFPLITDLKLYPTPASLTSSSPAADFHDAIRSGRLSYQQITTKGNWKCRRPTQIVPICCQENKRVATIHRTGKRIHVQRSRMGPDYVHKLHT